MKKKVLLSSIATIALCLCLIAGSTFALFTSKSEVDISVKAAKVEMTASLSDLKLESVKADPAGTIVDEFGGTYSYVECKDNFINGGTATFDKATLNLERVTPGDKVSFNVQGANTSDVTIQYRYIIECIGDSLLMSGLIVTVEDIAYPALDSYTSVWKTLQPGENITPAPIVIELPVNAGNDYKEQTTKIKVTVEAVQGNADVQGTKPVVEFLDGYTADLDDQTVETVVNNYGKVDLANGTIDVDFAGFQNFGEATLTDMTVDAGTADDYGVIANAGSVTVLNNTNVNSAGGAIAAVNGAKLTFNSGSVAVNTTSTSDRYLFYVVGDGTVVTINDGEFADFTKTTQNQKRAYAYVGEGATLYITGGTFGKASTRSGYTAGILGDGDIIITGGTFGFNPSAWVAEGYTAVKNGSTWVVVPGEDGIVVSDRDSLQAALDNATGKYTIILANDITGDVTVTQKPDVKITIEGNGKTFAGVLLVDGKSATILSAGLTVKNVNFVAESISADACIRLGNGTNATRYTCNVTVSGCTFDVPGAVGVKSYTGGDKNLVITGCTATARAHSLAQLKGIDGVLVENCTVEATRGISFNNSNNVTVVGSSFDVEKYALRFGEGDKATGAAETYLVENCTLESDCQGDAVIVLRGTADKSTLTIKNTTIKGSIEITNDATDATVIR